MTEPVLKTAGLSKNFGALRAANAIEFELEPGARHALIGPNGAGKTTFVNLITGALEPSAGRVYLSGEDITGLSQAERVKRGIARTFQITTLFRGLTVLENVYIPVAERLGAAAALWRPAGHRGDVIDEALGLLEMLHLEDVAHMPVRELPYGRQRLIEIAIALGLDPKVLLLDEPAAGVPAAESTLLLDIIDGLPSEIAVLIIEHDMDVVFRFAGRVTVLVQGAILTEGTPKEIAADERVREVYLGERRDV